MSVFRIMFGVYKLIFMVVKIFSVKLFAPPRLLCPGAITIFAPLVMPLDAVYILRC